MFYPRPQSKGLCNDHPALPAGHDPRFLRHLEKKRLIDEINELHKRVENGDAPPGVQPDNIVAIDIVRQIGNIGAHMGADINVIVEVDPDEAQTLIDLTETLFSDWYVARAAREQQMRRLKLIADEKKTKKKDGPPALEPEAPHSDET